MPPMFAAGIPVCDNWALFPVEDSPEPPGPEPNTGVENCPATPVVYWIPVPCTYDPPASSDPLDVEVDGVAVGMTRMCPNWDADAENGVVSTAVNGLDALAE